MEHDGCPILYIIIATTLLFNIWSNGAMWLKYILSHSLLLLLGLSYCNLRRICKVFYQIAYALGTPKKLFQNQITVHTDPWLFEGTLWRSYRAIHSFRFSVAKDLLPGHKRIFDSPILKPRILTLMSINKQTKQA